MVSKICRDNCWEILSWRVLRKISLRQIVVSHNLYLIFLLRVFFSLLSFLYPGLRDNSLFFQDYCGIYKAKKFHLVMKLPTSSTRQLLTWDQISPSSELHWSPLASPAYQLVSLPNQSGFKSSSPVHSVTHIVLIRVNPYVLMKYLRILILNLKPRQFPAGINSRIFKIYKIVNIVNYNFFIKMI